YSHTSRPITTCVWRRMRYGDGVRSPLEVGGRSDRANRGPADLGLAQNAGNEARSCRDFAMPGLVPGIHVLLHLDRKTWMAGTSPAMTETEFRLSGQEFHAVGLAPAPDHFAPLARRMFGHQRQFKAVSDVQRGVGRDLG